MSSPSSPRWLVLSLPEPSGAQGLLLVDALHRLGARRVGREGGRIVAHVPPPDELEDFLAEARAALRAASASDPPLDWRWEESEASRAAWRAELPARRLSERLAVVPAGVTSPGPSPPVVVQLAPGGAFGTAEHPTTRSCLRLLEDSVAGGERIADVGAGSGILAVAAVLLGGHSALALESDPHSVAVARENVRLNGLAERVEIRHVTVAPGILARWGPFDGLLANLGPDLLVELLPDMALALRPRGWLIVSGVPMPDRDLLLDAAFDAGLVLDRELLEDGWWTARLGRP